MAFGLGIWSAQAAEPDVAQVVRAVEVIQAQLGGEVSEAELVAAALGGMAAQLDRRSGGSGNGVLHTDEYERLSAWMRGERHGIGVEFGVVSGQGLMLTDVFPGGPAAEAGLVVGDLVVAVDDHPFTGMANAGMLGVVRRADPGQVIMDVRRPGGKLRRITVEQGAYEVGPVHPAEEGLPYVRLNFFGTGASEGLESALEALDPTDAVVLDLRDNDGGLLDEAVACAGLFLPPESVVLHEHAPDGVSTPRVAPGEQRWAGRVVLIVNRGTRGVAEAFVGALRDHASATVVGTRTAGVIGLPSYHPLGGELVLRLTDHRMSSPTGHSWAGVGFAPDLLVEALELSLPAAPGGPPPDLQRETAIRLIRAP